MDDKLEAQQHHNKPWDRLSNETKGEYELFLAYRNQDPRNIDSLAEVTRTNVTTIKHLKKINQWEERLLEEDIAISEQGIPKFKESLSLDENTNDLATMRVKHMRFAENTLAVANRALMMMDKYIKDAMIAQSCGKPSPKKPAVTVDQVVKLADFGAKLQRLTLGEASEIVDTKDDLDISSMSEKELVEFKQLMAKANPKKS